jgi:hypothetical protein
MGKHYVPQFLLRGFTDNGKLFVYDKVRALWFSSQPKSVANEADLWPDEIETFITETVEEPARNAIERLRQKLHLTKQERLALARYIAFLWKRVPAGRERFLKHTPDVAEKIRRDLNSQLASEEQRIKSNIYIDKIIAEPPAALWHASMGTEFKGDFAGAVANMHWVVLHTDEPSYLASDNPVFFFAADGLGRPTSELTIPFSSRATLIGRNIAESMPLHVNAQPYQVKEINRRTAFNATRFIFAQTTLPWMTAFVTKNHTPGRGILFPKL